MSYFNAFQAVVYLTGAPWLFAWLVTEPFHGAPVLCIPLVIGYVVIAVHTVITVGERTKT